jgi:hypothetical protein
MSKEEQENNIVEINSETLFYIADDIQAGKIRGVGDSAGMIEFINNDDVGTLHVFVEGPGEISKEKFHRLCVSWLALNYPESIKFDDE